MCQAVYFHIPFCEQICHYCDFAKVYLKNQPVDEYLDMMAKEMQNTVHRFGASKMKTMYVGGGTPTSLNIKQLDKFLNSIHSTFTLQTNYEFTFEANPNNIDFEKLTLLKDYGVNRLSIGVQTFDDDLLRQIGRDHTEEHIYQIIMHARKAGFHNISIDLMFGLPMQTVDKFELSIDKALSLDIDHVSAYGLQVEPKTVFYNRMRQGKLDLPSEESEVEMFELLINKLTDHGFEHYEISNFAKSGKESKHNLTYWNNEPYYGIGAGAHSYVANVRRSNAIPLKKYMTLLSEEGFPYVEETTITKHNKIEEELFLGLRKRAGISKTRFYEKYNVSIDELFGDVIHELINKELIQTDGETIRLTDKGVFLGNEVFQAFLIEHI